MRFHSADLTVSSSKSMEIVDVTEQVDRVLAESRIRNGVLNLWVPHTTAAIMVNEHEPNLWEDILTILGQLVPPSVNYLHDAKYARSTKEQNARAHILNCLVKPSISLPIEEGRVLLGTWQSILFLEMDGPRTRSIHAKIMGE